MTQMLLSAPTFDCTDRYRIQPDRY